jgi:hypothetical protein
MENREKEGNKFDGGNMRNQNEGIGSNQDKDVGNEYTRRPNDDFDSSPRRDEESSDISRDDLERKDSGSMGSPSGRH